MTNSCSLKENNILGVLLHQSGPTVQQWHRVNNHKTNISDKCSKKRDILEKEPVWTFLWLNITAHLGFNFHVNLWTLHTNNSSVVCLKKQNYMENNKNLWRRGCRPRPQLQLAPSAEDTSTERWQNHWLQEVKRHLRTAVNQVHVMLPTSILWTNQRLCWLADDSSVMFSSAVCWPSLLVIQGCMRICSRVGRSRGRRLRHQPISCWHSVTNTSRWRGFLEANLWPGNYNNLQAGVYSLSLMGHTDWPVEIWRLK